MQKEKLRRLILRIVVITAIIVAIILFIYVLRSILVPVGSSTDKQGVSENGLTNTALNRGVRLSIRGPITSDENFRTIVYEVSPSSRAATIYQGYNNTVLDRKWHDNSLNAYTQFVYALDRAGYTNSRTISSNDNDTRGICASGRLYTIETLSGTSPDMSLWTTSCTDSNTRGSFTGSAGTIRNLFASQFPEKINTQYVF